MVPESVSASATGHDAQPHVTQFRLSSGMLESVLKAPPDAAAAAASVHLPPGNKSHVLRYGGRTTAGNQGEIIRYHKVN